VKKGKITESPEGKGDRGFATYSSRARAVQEKIRKEGGEVSIKEKQEGGKTTSIAASFKRKTNFLISISSHQEEPRIRRKKRRRGSGEEKAL